MDLYTQIKSVDGTPRLIVNGKEVAPILFGLSDFPGAAANTAYAQKNIKQFADQGIHLVTADSELRLGWHKVTPFESEPIQEEIASILQADPNSGILLRLHANAPYWWMRDNMDENILYRGKPGIDNGDTDRLIRDDNNGMMRVSLASQKWLKEAGECLRQFCEDVWNTEEGKHIIGIQIACGLYGEWAHWGIPHGEDTSKPMQDRFHRLLHELYDTDEALQTAWGRTDVTRDTAPFLPMREQPGDDGIFRHPVISRPIMDSQLCIQLVLAEDILYFNKIIKEAWERPILTGAFYSYINSEPRPIGGHLLSELLFKNRDLIDYLCGPFPYLQNRKAEHIPMQRGILESVRLNGMLWLTEMDGHPAGTEHFVGGDMNLIDESVSMLRRNVLQPILLGNGLWFYDHRLIPQFVPKDGKNPFAGSIYRKNGWWDNAVLLKEIKMLYELTEKYAHGAYQPAADVLLVYAPHTYFSTVCSPDSEFLIQEAVARSGVAYDCIFLEDLRLADMDRYRCVIFTNAFALTHDEKQLIKERTKDKHVVWLYAPGYVDERSLSVDNMISVTGITLKKTVPKNTCVFPDGRKITLHLENLEPMFEVSDSDAQPIAYYEDSEAIAVARKDNVWYYAFPQLDSLTLIPILESAGVHRYCTTGDPILAGEGLVAINAYAGFDSKLFFRNGKQIHVSLPKNTTAIFDAQTAERLA